MKKNCTPRKPLIVPRWIASASLATGLALLSGCASTPKSDSTAAGSAENKSAAKAGKTMTPEQILNQDDVKGKPASQFNQPLEKVREAGLRSLIFVGCEIKKSEPYYVAGRRPNKMGLFVGSGGETVKVFLYPKSDNETQVWVDTDMSFVGLAGQQNWSDKVLAEMTSILNQPATTR